ncbi:Serine/threonine protein kinase [Mycena kentingensis (nom. inval.)]|nr:Serine/threonine protein kinase [Mycena kentingensis (nom. inval.)]
MSSSPLVDFGCQEFRRLLRNGKYSDGETRIYTMQNLEPFHHPPTAHAIKCVNWGTPFEQRNTKFDFNVLAPELAAQACDRLDRLSLRRDNQLPSIFVETKAHFFVSAFDLSTGCDLHSAIREGVFAGHRGLIKHTFRAIIDAVQWLHKRGVYHRNINTHNVLVDIFKGEVLLSNFESATTSPSSIDIECGTIAYLPPEALVDGPFVSYGSADSDRWALTIILVNLLTRTIPWRAARVDDKRFRSFLASSGVSGTTLDNIILDASEFLCSPAIEYDSLKDNFLRKILPISLPLTRLLVRCFAPQPSDRPRLSTMRFEVLELIELYMTDLRLQRSSRALRDAAGYDHDYVWDETCACGAMEPDVPASNDLRNDDESVYHSAHSSPSEIHAAVFNDLLSIRAEFEEMSSKSNLPVAQRPSSAPRRIAKAVRRASIASVGSMNTALTCIVSTNSAPIPRPRRASIAGVVASKRELVLLNTSTTATPSVPIQVDLAAARAEVSRSGSEGEETMEEEAEKKVKQRRRSSITAGLSKLVGTLRGRRESAAAM